MNSGGTRTLLADSINDELTSILSNTWSIVVSDAYGKALVERKFTKIELLQMGVVLMFDVKQKRQAVEDAPAIYLLQPRAEYINTIVEDIKNKLYKSYTVCFLGPNLASSNIVPLFKGGMSSVGYKPDLKVLFKPMSFLQVTPSVVSSCGSPSTSGQPMESDLMSILSVISSHKMKPSFFHTRETLNTASAAINYVQMLDPSLLTGTMDTLVFIVPWTLIIEDLLTPQWTYGGYLARHNGLNCLDTSGEGDKPTGITVRESSVYFPLLDKQMGEVGEKAATIVNSYVDACKNIHESLEAGQGDTLLETASMKEDIDTHSKLLKDAFASFDRNMYFERYRDGSSFFDRHQLTAEQLKGMDEDERMALEVSRTLLGKGDAIPSGTADSACRDRCDKMKKAAQNILAGREAAREALANGTQGASAGGKQLGVIAEKLKGLVGAAYKKANKGGSERRICSAIQDALVQSPLASLRPISRVSCVERPRMFVWVEGMGSVDAAHELTKCFKDTVAEVVFGASSVPSLKDILGVLEKSVLP